jgi:YtcA family
MTPRESIRANLWPSTMAVAATPLAGCDPVVNIAGASFPAWLLCAIIGALGIAILRPVLTLSGLEPHLWWRPGFYSSLGITIACLVWIIFFNRT